MATQVLIAEDYGRNSAKKMIVHDTEVPNFEARLAIALLERWGLVTAEQDGEDSAGRAKLKPASPELTVRNACDTASLAAQAFRERGWMVAAPDVNELLRKIDD